jgi:phosphonatase-like hydrolase
MVKQIEMVVFDMAGTTVQDNNEVEKCFFEAANKTCLTATHAEINSMMGWSKIKVFETLWRKNLAGETVALINQKTHQSFEVFKEVLENHYRMNDVFPTIGTLELFAYLKSKGIKIALTTGFYREVTDIILLRLGWNNTNRIIDVSVASDEVISGRPSPFMIFRAMELCGINDVRKVIKIGDTPSDLYEGKNAGCKYTYGITNGTHTLTELERYENDGCFANMIQFRDYLENS